MHVQGKGTDGKSVDLLFSFSVNRDGSKRLNLPINKQSALGYVLRFGSRAKELVRRKRNRVTREQGGRNILKSPSQGNKHKSVLLKRSRFI